MTMVDGREMVIQQRELPEGDFEVLRFLGGNNNNNNNQNNNNNNNNSNSNNYSTNNQSYNANSYDSFNSSLFVGTVGFCLASLFLVMIRIKCHRRNQTTRKRLGMSRSRRKGESKEVSDNASVVTDEEILRYIRPDKQEQSMKEAARVVRCDKETGRIMAICRPFWFQAAVSGVCDIFTTALLGKAIGVDALAIYYIVSVPTSFTETIISAILETVSSLGGQSIGVGSFKLTGQYCQISIILYTILFIPHVFLWVTYLKPILRWFAPDLSEDVIEEGYIYFLVGLVGTYIGAFSTVLHSLLEVMDHYKYSMLSSVASEITSVIAFLAYLIFDMHGQKSIVWLGVIHSVTTILFLVIDVTVTKRRKWFGDVWKGILRSVAMKNWEAVWLVLKTAAPLSMGNVLLTVEWELLAIFAAGMGETYVAAWGIIGTIWGILEYATDCVAAAGEIRVAKLLGNGNPRQAKLSSYKCLFLGNFYASLMSIAFLYGLPVIPGWFTEDQFLMSLIANVLPYCAIGNLTLTFGSLAWTLVGAQGRYGLATYHGCVGSVGVTIPFAVLSTYYFDLELPGLASAVVVGYMVSGALNSMTLFLTDWEYISYRVMIRNGATEPIDEEEEEEEEEKENHGWSLFGFMNQKIDENFLDDDSYHSHSSSRKSKRRGRGRGKVLIDNMDDSMSVASTQSGSTSSSRGRNKGRSWWSGFELDYTDDSEVREVIIGPGRLGYSIQSTEEGPMVVGMAKEPTSSSLFGMTDDSEDYRSRAKIYQGEFYLGDIIIQVDKIPTDRMSGKQLAKVLHKSQNQPSRTILVSHREGTALTTVYQPGPYGSAAIAGVIENAKGMSDY